MDSSFLPYHARVQKPIALIDKAEHIALIFYSLGKPTKLWRGEGNHQSQLISLTGSLQKYGTPSADYYL